MTPRNLTVERALRELDEHGGVFQTLFNARGIEVEMYRPQGEDRQTPHERDELYVVARGRGEFLHGDHRQTVETGQVLFVPAGEAHRFVNFSEDFATWVIFFESTP